MKIDKVKFYGYLFGTIIVILFVAIRVFFHWLKWYSPLQIRIVYGFFGVLFTVIYIIYRHFKKLHKWRKSREEENNETEK